jgi:hypothetical protein
MIGTEARTTNGGTTGTNETRHVASTAAARLGGPLENARSRDTASEAETDVGPRADFNNQTVVGSGAAATVRRMQASGSVFAVWGRTFG